MILLTTLLCVGGLAAMLFSMQRAVWLYTLLHQKTNARHLAFEALEQTARGLLKNHVASPDKACLSDKLDVQYAVSQLRKNKGCQVRVDGVTYRYWLNRLGHQQPDVLLALQMRKYVEAIFVVRYAPEKGVIQRWFLAGQDHTCLNK